MKAWLTPDSLPTGGDICRPLFIPDDIYLLAAVNGALEELAKSYNWEQFGSITPEATAERMRDMLDAWYSQPCGGGGMAIGTIFPYVTADPPAGSILCDGQEYEDTDYPALWAVISDTWKTDASHFVVPDLRNRFPVGAGDTYDESDTGGEATHTITLAEMPAHGHQTYVHDGTTTRLAYNPGSSAPGNYGPPQQRAPAINLNFSSPWLTGSAGSGNAHENRPPFVALFWAVQAE